MWCCGLVGGKERDAGVSLAIWLLQMRLQMRIRKRGRLSARWRQGSGQLLRSSRQPTSVGGAFCRSHQGLQARPVALR